MAPTCFPDLNLDQLVGAVLEQGHGEDVMKLFYVAAGSADEIRYRQDIFRDLQDPVLGDAARAFVGRLREVDSHLQQLSKWNDSYLRQGWFLDAAAIYCDAVGTLTDQLDSAPMASQGLRGIRDRLTEYRAGGEYVQLAADARSRREDLGRVRYCVRVMSGRVEVSRYEGLSDYSDEIEETFRRFQQGAVKEYLNTYRTPPSIGRVGLNILQLLARLFPEEFSALATFCQRHAEFRTEQISRLAFELAFYLSYLDYTAPLAAAGLPLCYPEVGESTGATAAEDTYDICLASKLVAEGSPVVLNSFRLEGPERIFVVSGPNQGGKTTFARTFGQLHQLAAIGCPIPGKKATVGLFDQIFTHFQREEDLSDLRGKLEDDLVRVRSLLERSTDRSVVILNEVFTSTTLDDARLLGTRIMTKLIDAGVRAVYVTFVDELAFMGPPVVSMMSSVEPTNPAQRTFRVVRAPANGLAYALAIAAKYDLTYERLKTRLPK
ncbi:MAG TPA: hypothetical protein VLX59_06915 [Acidimicrobiales bacterium]|nr:hypothetical protein [Acidimicrobiales bacterium]